jgi:iron complex outermembrane receptor protein
MSVKLKRALWLGSAVTIALAGFASVAVADDAEKVKVTEGVQIAQAEAPAPAPAAEEEKKVERVVVTGSRLKKNEFTSSAPIQVITREETTLEGLNDTGDILQGSTLSAGSQQINNTFGGFVTQGGPGANTLSLRGLGAQRTLVLVNGRRIAPAGTRGQTGQADLNTVPESMIDRIEILKDGGSSIYGSDAVAGVVNIITRKNYDGIELSAATNQTEAGGGATYQLNGLWGETFDRGHFMVTGEYYRRDPLRFGDRDYFACAQDLVYDSGSPVNSAGAAGRVSSGGAGSLLDIIDPATGQSKCFNLLEGVIDRVAAGGRYIPNAAAVAGGGPFGADLAGWQRVGLTYGQVAGALTGFGGTPVQQYDAMSAAQRTAVEAAWRANNAIVPNDDPRFLSTTLIAPVTRYSFFGEGSYDLLPGMEAYTELAFVRRESEQERWRQLFPNVCGAGANSYGVFSPLDVPATALPCAGGALPAVFGGGAVVGGTNLSNPFGGLARSIAQVATDSEQTVDFYRAVFGVKGDLGEKMPLIAGWSYDLFVQHSRSEGDYTNDIIYNDRVNATTGPGTCIQALITVSGGSCASIPTGISWFDPNFINNGVLPANQMAFLFGKEVSHTTYSQSIVNGVITGDVVELPYGTVAAALGFEVRRDELDDTPGLNQRSNNLWGQSSAGRTAGDDSVAEVFGEVSIPLLAGMKFAEELTLDASTRYTNYDSYGDGSTYKLGLNYQITPEYRVRGTTGTSFRAPALFELYLANLTGFSAQTALDPCNAAQTNATIQASCAAIGLNYATYNPAIHASALVLQGGGPNLTAETSEARTVGFIWTPDWVDFSVAVDYWEFEVNNEVAQFGAANIVNACHSQAPVVNAANPFCQLYTRDLTGVICVSPGLPVGCNASYGKIVQVNNSYTNISDQTSDGLDLTARYEREFSFGTLLINAQTTWTFTDEIRVFKTFATNTFNGEVYDADFTANVDVRFDWTDWTFFWNIDMASRASNDEGAFAINGDLYTWRGTPFVGEYKQYTEFVATHDLSARYRADDWSVTFGVQNVLDDPPPNVSAGGAFGKTGNSVAIGGPYDLLGRRGFVEVTKEF